MWVGVEATCEGGARRKEAQYNSRRGARSADRGFGRTYNFFIINLR